MIGRIPIWKALCCIIISISLASCMKSAEVAELNSPYIEAVDSDLIDSDPYEDEVCLKPIPNFKKEGKVDEVVALWNLFFDLQSAPIDDPRRKSFKTYAECVVDAAEYYQVWETDLGGSLPEDDLAHLVIGTVIALESSVNPTVRGKLGEIGLTQVWGTALSDFSRAEVSQDPKLQIVLGTRWLAYQNKVCRTDDWIRLLSSYGAGKRNPTCKSLSFARYRYSKVKYYQKLLKELKSLD